MHHSSLFKFSLGMIYRLFRIHWPYCFSASTPEISRMWHSACSCRASRWPIIKVQQWWRVRDQSTLSSKAALSLSVMLLGMMTPRFSWPVGKALRSVLPLIFCFGDHCQKCWPFCQFGGLHRGQKEKGSGFIYCGRSLSKLFAILSLWRIAMRRKREKKKAAGLLILGRCARYWGRSLAVTGWTSC